MIVTNTKGISLKSREQDKTNMHCKKSVKKDNYIWKRWEMEDSKSCEKK